MELKLQIKKIKKGDLFKIMDYFSNSEIQNKINPAIVVFFHENSNIFQEKIVEIEKELKKLTKEQQIEFNEYNKEEIEIFKKYLRFDSKGNPILNNGKYVFKNQNDEEIFNKTMLSLNTKYQKILTIIKEYKTEENKILNEIIEFKIYVLPFDKLPNINLPFYIIKTISDYKLIKE